jgi:UDP-N-acetylmuramoylalanine-D-glutamate ligase
VTIKNNDGKKFVEGREIDMDAWITRLTRSLGKRESARVQYHDCEDAVTAAIHFAQKQGVPAKRIEAVLTSFHEGSRY